MVRSLELRDSRRRRLGSSLSMRRRAELAKGFLCGSWCQYQALDWCFVEVIGLTHARPMLRVIDVVEHHPPSIRLRTTVSSGWFDEVALETTYQSVKIDTGADQHTPSETAHLLFGTRTHGKVQTSNCTIGKSY